MSTEMGRSSDDEGETSTKTCDSMDDRPLKKARYVWQIKGKYHLKKSDDDRNALFVSESSNENDQSYTCIKCPDCECKFNVFEASSSILETSVNNIKQSPNVDGIKVKNRILEQSTSNVNVSTCSLPLNRQRMEHSLRTGKIRNNNHIDGTWQLRKWQARQVARCFVDNTINRVLEDMGFVPLPIDADDILDEDLPITENENDGGGLEDEAVMMAIHSHGLQRTDTGDLSGAPDREKSIESSLLTSPRLAPMNCSQLWDYKNNVVDEERSIPDNSRVLFETCISTRDSQSCNCCNSGLETTDLSSLGKQMCMEFISCPSEQRNSYIANCDLLGKNCLEQTNPLTLKQVSSTTMVLCSTEPFQQRVLSRPRYKEACPQHPIEDRRRIEEKRSSFEHKDFLDKAVAVAIKKKGLSTLSSNDFR